MHIYRSPPGQAWTCLATECSIIGMRKTSTGSRPGRTPTGSLALHSTMACKWNRTGYQSHIHFVDIIHTSGRYSVTKHFSSHIEEVSLAAPTADCDFDENSSPLELGRKDANPWEHTLGQITRRTARWAKPDPRQVTGARSSQRPKRPILRRLRLEAVQASRQLR